MKRILIIAVLAFLAGYFVLWVCNTTWEHYSGLDKQPKTEQEVAPKNQQEKERPVSKKVYAPIKEI